MGRPGAAPPRDAGARRGAWARGLLAASAALALALALGCGDDDRRPPAGDAGSGADAAPADGGADGDAATCAEPCAPGTSCCWSFEEDRAACVDVATQQRHCGGCNLACPLGYACVAGSCASP